MTAGPRACTLLLALLIGAGASARGEDLVRYTYRRADDHLQVRIDAPARCRLVPDKPAAAVPAEQAVPECVHRVAEGVCTAYELRVPFSERPLDRAYPAAFRLGSALYSHLANFFRGWSACSRELHRFQSPIVHQGRWRAPGYWIDAGAARRDPAVLFVRAQAPGLDDSSYLDPALDDATRALISSHPSTIARVVDAIVPGLRREPTFIAAGTVHDGSGQPRFWGDQTGIMRLALYNWPSEVDASLHRRLAGFLSHEMAHAYQPAAMKAAKGGEVWTEGGAEFIRWYAGGLLGLSTPRQMSDELATAAGTCQRAPAGSLDVYSCGLVLHVLVLASARDASALERLLGAYRRIATMDAADPGDVLECGGREGCVPAIVRGLMSGGIAEAMRAFDAGVGQTDGRTYPFRERPIEDILALLGFDADRRAIAAAARLR